MIKNIINKYKKHKETKNNLFLLYNSPSLLDKAIAASKLTEEISGYKENFSLYSENYFKPGLCSLHSMLLELERVLKEVSREQYISHSSPVLVKDDIRLDKWMLSLNTSVYSEVFSNHTLVSGYLTASILITKINNELIKKEIPAVYINRVCFKVLETYITLTKVLLELIRGKRNRF